jgi:DNA-binding transcriptional regulator YiaG
MHPASRQFNWPTFNNRQQLPKTAATVLCLFLNGESTTATNIGDMSLVNDIRNMTSTGFKIIDNVDQCDSSKDVIELKSQLGITWEQFATIFDVSRRSAHSWASGEKMNSENHEHLMHILQAHRDLGSSVKLDRKILYSSIKGVMPINLLQKQKYEEYKNVLQSIVRLDLDAEQSIESNKNYFKLPIADVLDLKQDRAHEYPVARKIVKVKKVNRIES